MFLTMNMNDIILTNIHVPGESVQNPTSWCYIEEGGRTSEYTLQHSVMDILRSPHQGEC